jgi:hypothetical protein
VLAHCPNLIQQGPAVSNVHKQSFHHSRRKYEESKLKGKNIPKGMKSKISLVDRSNIRKILGR